LSDVIRAIQLEEPNLQFYLGTHTNPRRIIALKPFSYNVLLNKEAGIKVLTDNDSLTLGEKLVQHLIDGFSIFGERMPGFYEAFGVALRFDRNHDVKITSAENFLSDLEEALDSLRSESSKDSGGVVLAIVKDLAEDTYREAKVKVITGYSALNLRTQFVRKETIEKYAGTRGYVYLLMNIASAIYAKISGTPWKLARSVLSVKGLILGISFSRKRENASNREVIYYGVVQVFDRFGEHLDTQIRMFIAPRKDLETKGLYIPRDSMVKILSSLFEKYGRIPQIVIHKSAPVVEEELDAVKEIISRYGDVQHPMFYVFSHIKSNVMYRAYDPSATDYSVRRGLILLRSGKSSKWIQYIVFTTGRFYRDAMERNKLGTPRPLEISIATNMPRLVPNIIGEQILALTKLDWNTTDPEAREPITIKYSRRAAQIAPQLLKRVGGQDMRIADIRDLM